MTTFYGVIGCNDFIKDQAPAGWLCSLAYGRDDVPRDCPRIWDIGVWSYKALEVPRLGRAAHNLGQLLTVLDRVMM